LSWLLSAVKMPKNLKRKRRGEGDKKYHLNEKRGSPSPGRDVQGKESTFSKMRGKPSKGIEGEGGKEKRGK